ncbi:DNA repair and recombination protein RadB [Methanofollis aquaemaris]|uniref:DNA repair and recombination protein RadB n=1 Tax=Methanofollis aquaemaris TaxID=126734 RepID=A0A8A3S5R1_9EURY|nr:DNA repair and recombination protein RadB [Methanofollis aquaemaris]QSZ67199.1 DNA repair and recombination protein RadB [Methanofollis aquaemaris]
MKLSKASTGSAPLDDLLGGGLERRTITQVYGEPGSGKSTLAVMAAVACLRAGEAVVYIDTEGFSTERFEQIAGGEVEALAERLYLYEPVDFVQEGMMINECEALLRAREVGLIVMDSATALYRSELGTKRDGLRTLSRHMVLLLGYAKRYEVPVLITNQVYQDIDTDVYFGLGGTALGHICKAILRIEKRKDGVRRVVLEKHRSRPADICFDYVITNEGIRKVER